MPTSLDARATAEAVAGNLNLIEFTREDCRWQRPHTIIEVDGVMLFAGASDFPAYNNGVHREFFAARGRGYSIWVRDTGEDDDLRAAADAASILEFADSPQMICRTPLPDEPLHVVSGLGQDPDEPAADIAGGSRDEHHDRNCAGRARDDAP